MDEKSKQIARLNDVLRTSFNPVHGQIMLTQGIVSLPLEDQKGVLELVKSFNDFPESKGANDPYGEHDFGTVEHNGQKAFWKIDYYAPDLIHGSEDPADPKLTNRVLTIMLACEY